VLLFVLLSACLE